MSDDLRRAEARWLGGAVLQKSLDELHQASTIVHGRNVPINDRGAATERVRPAPSPRSSRSGARVVATRSPRSGTATKVPSCTKPSGSICRASQRHTYRHGG